MGIAEEALDVSATSILVIAAVPCHSRSDLAVEEGGKPLLLLLFISILGQDLCEKEGSRKRCVSTVSPRWMRSSFTYPCCRCPERCSSVPPMQSDLLDQ